MGTRRPSIGDEKSKRKNRLPLAKEADPDKTIPLGSGDFKPIIVREGEHHFLTTSATIQRIDKGSLVAVMKTSPPGCVKIEHSDKIDAVGT